MIVKLLQFCGLCGSNGYSAPGSNSEDAEIVQAGTVGGSSPTPLLASRAPEQSQLQRSSLLPKGRPREGNADGTSHALREGARTDGSKDSLHGQLQDSKKGSKGSRTASVASLVSEDEDICSTCLEGYTPDNPKIWTNCHHHFHLACIYEWLERSETCPICATRLTFEELL
ncbi:probable E3 ubiquitin-protein ligase At3g02290 at C-terminar half [Coccomyxa sp. Obi]|nr:probable E3 ubiquitin-protein ligase At3g02290 at C-terminar half [Coccomyxa sp. Obi]